MMRKFSVILIAAAVLFLGVSGAALAQSMTVQVASVGGVNFLTDAEGMTLYYFTKDVAGESVCFGRCLGAWPVFDAQTVTVLAELSEADFGTFVRDDGSNQTTYKGWPLYYWFRDIKAGDMLGENVGKEWFVMKVPYYTVLLATSPTLGNYLTDAKGNSLYLYTEDTANQSVCIGNCLRNWPAFFASHIVAPTGVETSDFDTIARDDGAKQTTYKGWPLYYWVRDANRGDTTGQDVGEVWYVIDPATVALPSM